MQPDPHDAAEPRVERREFMKALGLAGAASLLPWSAASAAETAQNGAAAAAPVQTASRTALAELIGVLQQVDQVYLSPARGIRSAEDVSDGHRFLLHALAGGLEQYAERDALRPVFTRIVTPWRKFLGDNPDAVYYTAP